MENLVLLQACATTHASQRRLAADESKRDPALAVACVSHLREASTVGSEMESARCSFQDTIKSSHHVWLPV